MKSLRRASIAGLIIQLLSFVPDVNAEGLRLFVNRTKVPLQIAVGVRDGTNVKKDAGMQVFTLSPGARNWTTFGSPENSLLNAISITGPISGTEVTTTLRVDKSGTAVDRLLNQNNAIEVALDGTQFTLAVGKR